MKAMTPTNETMKTMKNQIKTAAAALGLIAIGLMASSCADKQTIGTHEMGPPGKTHTMPDKDMPSRAN